VTDKEDGSLQGGTIPAENVKVTLAYNTMGSDLTLVAQAHEAASSHPGLSLIEKSDCKSCHAQNNKSVGPSYRAISQRYKKDDGSIKKLAAKVISGGSGVWGEHAMSAHPQLSVTQASEMVSYILSVKDQGKNTMPVPPSGVIHPNKSGGEYILSVSYQDKERMGVEANTVKKNFHFKSPKLKAVASDDDKAVAKLGESVVRFTENGSWLLFKNIDLTRIGTVLFFVDPSGIGGKLTLRVDGPSGQKIGAVSIPQVKRPQKAGADQNDYKWRTVQMKTTPQAGNHDLYIVYTDPAEAKSDVWKSLFLDWIEFRR
jgi:cytochrome c